MIPHIPITRFPDLEEGASAVLALTEQHSRDIRHRAFDHFQQRGQILGNEWDDWLRAERELLWMARAEMFENNSTIVLRVAVPGFSPKSLQVTATPQYLLIEGTEAHDHDGLDARVHFCEFGKTLFRRFDLPRRIDPSTVCATLDKGIMEILANIAHRPEQDTDIRESRLCGN